MKASPQTIQQVERAIRKVASKYPKEKDAVLTYIHMLVKPDSGEILTYDDDDRELDRCVVEEWINCPLDDFYDQVAPILRKCLQDLRPVVEEMSILRPFSFVLVDDDHETLHDLTYIDDEDTVILQGELLKGLDDDLDAFLKDLLKDE